jgi:macrolide-specific efflux system membrane fusion protein
MSVHVQSTIEPKPGWFDRLSATAGLKTAELHAMARRRPYLSAGFAVLLIGAIGYGAYTLTSSSGPDYTTATVTRGDIEDSVTALGNLQPKNYVDVGAQATGQLKKLNVDIGDTVKSGQLLAEIDPQVQTAKVQTDQGNVANLQAQLTDRQAQYALAQANFERQQRLQAADATSKTDYDAAQQAMKSAAAQVSALRAQVAASQSQLNGDQVTLGYTKIYAPMPGTVVSVSIKQGQTINSVQQAPTILRIADLSLMTVWTQVSEADVPKLRVGMPAYFTTLGNPAKRWYGKLEQIQPTPTTTNNVVLYTATFDVANPDQQLMTQMTAQVFFVTASAHNVVIVPVSALHQGHVHAGGRTSNRTPNQGDGSAAQSSQTPSSQAPRPHKKLPQGQKRYTILVMAADGSVQPRRIVVGVSNRVSAEVVSGLNPGETVVTGVKQTSTTTAAASASRSGTASRPPGMGGFGGLH